MPRKFGVGCQANFAFENYLNSPGVIALYRHRVDLSKPGGLGRPAAPGEIHPPAGSGDQ